MPGDIASKFPFFKVSVQDMTVPGDTFNACAIIYRNKDLRDYL
jgi:hypothetical protein